MTSVTPAPAGLLASVDLRFTCERPEQVFRHGEDTPLSQAIDEAVAALLGANGLAETPDRSAIGVLGASQSGERHIFARISRRFREHGIYAIDPVFFSKTNQFFPVFSACKSGNVVGPSSSLFMSASHSAEILYFALLLIGRGHASHMIAVSYEEDRDDAAPEDGESRPLTGRFCAALLGPHDQARAGAPILSSCRLGPYLSQGEGRDRDLAALFRGLDDGLHLLLGSDRDRDAIARLTGARLVHVAPDRLTGDARILPGLLRLLGPGPDGGQLGPGGSVHVVPPEQGNALTLRYRLP